MRTTGRRTLAGIAAGALAFAGLAFVATPSAQAAQTVAAVCAGNGTGINGNAGTGTDPTTVQPNCTVVAGPTVSAPINPPIAAFRPAGAAYWQMTIDGPGVWVPLVAGADGAITNGGKTVTIDLAGLIANEAQVAVTEAGVNTVSVATSTAGGLNAVNPANTTPQGDLTVTGIGTTAGLVISEAYRVIPSNSATAVTVALVQVRDETGRNVPITAANVTLTAPTVDWQAQAVNVDATPADDCVDGVMTATGVGQVQNPSGLANVVPACLALTSGLGAGGGAWVQVDNTPNVNGPATIGVAVTVGTRSFTGSINITTSTPLAAAWTMAFEDEKYTPGALASLDICATDIRGLPVPDGLVGATTRNLAAGGAFNAQVISLAGTATASVNAVVPGGLGSIATYGGCSTARFTVPGTPMTLVAEATAGATGVGSLWASSAAGTTRTASTVIEGVTPTPTPTIVIVGERGAGDSANMVFVEGTTTEMAGKTVTPHFRFPGQTGFTAGTGTRTVDAEGNFSWQRKTGKQIAVQFRGEGVVSNTVIIAAK